MGRQVTLKNGIWEIVPLSCLLWEIMTHARNEILRNRKVECLCDPFGHAHLGHVDI